MYYNVCNFTWSQILYVTSSITNNIAALVLFWIFHASIIAPQISAKAVFSGNYISEQKINKSYKYNRN